MTEKKTISNESSELTISDKQTKITEIARDIFTSRCAQNEELKGYLDCFISNDEKNQIRDKESKERENKKQLYEKAKKEYEEYLAAEQALQIDEDFIFQPSQDDYYQFKKSMPSPLPSKNVTTGRVGYYPDKTYDEIERQKALEEMIFKIRQAQSNPWHDPFATYPDPYARPSNRQKKIPLRAPSAPMEGPSYDDHLKSRLNGLSEQMNKEIELSFFLAKLFVDRRLKVLK